MIIDDLQNVKFIFHFLLLAIYLVNNLKERFILACLNKLIQQS